MSRIVTLVLLDSAGSPLGALPPYEVPAPWWQDVDDVVDGARRRHGVGVTVLRLLDTEPGLRHGGAVTYLAGLSEADPGPPAGMLTPVDVDLSPDPLRASWAVPGGPTRSLRWAANELARLGRGRFTAAQRRAWNLSTIWRLDPVRSGGSPVWLKQVPHFFGHEAAVLRWLGAVLPGAAPTLLAAGDVPVDDVPVDDAPADDAPADDAPADDAPAAGDAALADHPAPGLRMLLDHVPGQDCYGADATVRDAIAADQHRIQTLAAARIDELLRGGVPDRRGSAFARTVRDELARHGADLSAVRGLLDGLDERLAAVAACGLPESLVHGDLHPGNVRSDGTRRVIIDWGDAFVGHPAFDILRLVEGLPEPDATRLALAWSRRWRQSVPGCDPMRAYALLRPVAALRAAAVFAGFVSRIEPTERRFHDQDVPEYLIRAAELSTTGTSDCQLSVFASKLDEP